MLFHNYRLDRVAVVDAFSTGHLLGPAFRARGVGVVHVVNDVDHSVAQRATFHAADFEADLAHSEAEHEQVVAALRDWRVGHVVAGTESGSDLADVLARDIGASTANAGAPETRRDKRAMHRAVDRSGVAVPWQQHVDADGCIAWQTSGRRPFRTVVKPAMSAGTDSVIHCSSPNDEARAVRAVLDRNNIYGNKNTGAVVQEFLEGPEYAVNTVSVDGTHAFTELWRSDKFTVNGNTLYDRQVLLDPTASSAVELIGYVRAVLTALGVRWGAGHTEIVDTAAGARLLETATRLPGGVDPSLTLAALGRSQIDEVVEAYLAPDLVLDRGELRVPRRAAMGVSLMSTVEGPVRRAVDLRPIIELPSFHSAKIAVQPGGILERTRDLLSKPGGVYLCHADADQLERDYAAVREWETTALAAAIR